MGLTRPGHKARRIFDLRRIFRFEVEELGRFFDFSVDVGFEGLNKGRNFKIGFGFGGQAKVWTDVLVLWLRI